MKFRIAYEAEIEDRRKATLLELRQISVESSAISESEFASATTLDPEMFSYLLLIRDNPALTATERDRLLGYFGGKGNRMRMRLKKHGLIEEFWTAGKQNRRAKDVRLTDRARTILSANI